MNGDPFTDGKNIIMTTSTTTNVVFNETSGTVSVSTVSAGDTVTINGFTYTYDYLGSGDVGGDPTQPAAFIRILSGDPGAPLTTGTTFALDLTGQPGDPDYPNLPNGNSKLAVSDLDTTTDVDFPCFVAGTLIRTRAGLRPVEEIEAGDEVWTRDNGFRPVRWVGQARVRAHGAMAPVVFAPGTIGNDRELRVSPQHRMLLTGWPAQLYCGEEEILVAAIHLLRGDAIRQVGGGMVTYVHLLLDAHEILEADGAWSESLYLGDATRNRLPSDALAEIATLFPDLDIAARQAPAARPVRKAHEARLCQIA